MEINKLSRPVHLQKAYLIALCLTAQRVLAETTEEGKAPEEKALLDQVLENLTQPAGIASVCVAFAVILGIVFMGMSGGKDSGSKVTLDDLPTRPPKKKQESTKTKEEEEEDEWSDEDVDKDEMYKEMDEVGPFVKTIQGTLEPDSLVKLRKIINKWTYKSFMTRKAELMEERLGYLKTNNMTKYT